MKMKKMAMIILAILGIAIGCGQSDKIEEMLEKRYPDAIVLEQNGYFLIFNNYKDGSGVCDLTGNEIIPPVKYTDIDFLYAQDGYFRVKIGDKMGICDVTGKEIIAPDYYTNILLCNNFIVEIDDRFGIYDLNGKEIMTTVNHSDIFYDQKYGFLRIKIEDKMGIFDLSGKEIIAPKYTDINFNLIEDGYFSVKIDDKEGICDLRGKEVIPCQYASVIYDEPLFRVRLKEGDSYTDYEPGNNYQNTPTSLSESKSLKLSGSWSITYENVKLAGEIKNNQPENWTSGTPLLKVFMTKSPYNGKGELKGHLYCQLKTSQIQGGNVRTINENNISYTRPSAGTYYTVLGLYEYDSGEYELVDYKNLNGTRTYSAASTTPSYQQPSFQPLQQDYSYLNSQYQFWEGQARNYYQQLGYTTDASQRMTYLSAYKDAQHQMQQIRMQANGNIQQSQFEFAPAPGNPGL